MLPKALALAFLALATAATPASIDFENPSTPPPGIGVSDLSQAAVVERYAKARAREIPWKSRVAHYTFDQSGLSGTVDEIARESDYRTSTRSGSFQSSIGSIAGRSWSQNYNAEVVDEQHIHRRDGVDKTVLEDPLHHLGDFKLLGRTSTPADAYVMRINPAGGRLEYVFLDAKTFAVDRIEAAVDGRRHIVTYDDFRSTQGYVDAWHIVEDDGYPANRRELHLLSVAYDRSVPYADLARPEAANPVLPFSSPALLTDRIVRDRVIVPVRIAGRLINLQLDSGASGIVIDRDILDALHITTIGSSTGTTAGSYSVGRAIVPSMTLGTLTMRNTVVYSLPFAMLTDEHTPVAGLLGFDFIDAVVLHIDYANGRVEALDPKAFTPPPNAVRVPVALDDQVPVASATIGDAIGNEFIIDTGADRSTLYSSFVAAHPTQANDQGLGEQMQASFPFTAGFQGVGGIVSYRPVQVADFRFAGSRFDRWLFNATYDAPAFEGDDFDGLIGQDVLRYFDVYLDYPDAALYFVPNKRYVDRFGP